MDIANGAAKHWLWAVLLLVLPAFPALAQPTIRDLLAPSLEIEPPRADASGAAEAKSGAPSGKPDNDIPPEDEFNRGTPRSAVEGYLVAADAGDYHRAAEYLDLRQVKGNQAALAPDLAHQLKVVLDRKLWIDPSALSTRPGGRKSEDLRSSLERVGKIKTQRGTVDVLLERVPRDDGTRIWKFSAETVALVPGLYAEFGYGPLGKWLSKPSLEIRIVKVQLWQWIGIALFAALATFASLLVPRLVIRILGPIMTRIGTDVGERLVRFSHGPLGLFLFVSVFSAGEAALGLSVAAETVLHAIEKVILIVAITWTFFRLLDVFGRVVVDRLLWRGHNNAVLLVAPARRALKAVLVAIALIASLDNFGYNVTALIAGLGIGGVAVALAAQKSVENLFGSITLYADQPVRVGDFCRFGSQQGTIEDIGLRSTRVRTVNRTMLSIPNAEFANLQIENYGRRDKFTFNPRLGLRAETTPDQLRYVLVELRKLLYAHPKVDNDSARARFAGFGACSLDVDVFAHVATPDYDQYLEVAEDLNFRILEIVVDAGSSLAFPSQTTYVESGTGIDRDRARVAEGRVAEWREKGALYVPHFPREKIRELQNTLEYPPKGSPLVKPQEDGRRR